MTVHTPSLTANRPMRIAAYLRVSTVRQAEHDVSLPSQQAQIERYCDTQNWQIAKVYTEAGASGTDANRPVWLQLLEDATAADHPYDAVVVHSYSRFARDLIGQELAVARLMRADVRLISITQPSGDNPAEQMMRKLISVFDEHQSLENSKNVKRSMAENASQGFHNGATPPHGYRSIEAERRGAKIKKVLAIDEVEADLVRTIFALYLGQHADGPLGVKKIVEWLNARGYQTRRGKHFSVAQIHRLLTNPTYIGRAQYSVRNSKTGKKHDPAQVIEVSVPRIISDADFEAVRSRLVAHNPKVTPPRFVTGPVLLAGLATCGECGGGLVMRTGTSKTGKIYTYYTCANRMTKGSKACRGTNVPMPALDDLVLSGIEEHLLPPERLLKILEALIARKRQFAANVDGRLETLNVERAKVESALKNIYKLVETGALGADDMLTARIIELRDQKTKIEATIERALANAAPISEVTPEALRSFGQAVREKLLHGDIALRRNYLRSVVGQVIVEPQKVTIVGSTHALHAAITKGEFSAPRVRSLVQKWRA